MPVAVIGFARSAASQRRSWVYRGLRALLIALDRLVPPGDAWRNGELPPEWFRHPPI
jgi:hypothetical protein